MRMIEIYICLKVKQLQSEKFQKAITEKIGKLFSY